MENKSVLTALVMTAVVTIGGLAMGSVLQRTVNEPDVPGIARQGTATDSEKAPGKINPVTGEIAGSPADRAKLQDRQEQQPTQESQQTSKPTDSEQLNQRDSESTSENIEPNTANTDLKQGSYEPYDQVKIAADSAETKLLFFNSVDCPDCRAFEQDILANDIPAGVAIFHIDYESSAELAAQYEVTEPGQLVLIDGSGKALKKHPLKANPSLAQILKTTKP